VRATPQAVIDMPAMPRMPEFAETAHAEPAPGDYGIHPTFAHGGEYRLRVTIEADATVEFPLSVNDAQARRKSVPPRFTLQLAASKPHAGEPADLRLIVRDRDNNNGPVTAFETVHERPIHLVLVRRDLTHFAHEHPTLGPDGIFSLRYTFPTPGEYRLFADLAPRSAGSQILAARITVSGKAADPASALPPDRGSYPVGKTIPITLATPTLPLEPWLGALGHLILIHEDAQTFVHSHPGDAGGFTFLARFPKAGAYHAWLQYQSAGQVHTEAFTLHAQ
jgi:hypothetical protein